MEMYEQQDPFKLTDFITMSYFLNQFLYKAVLTNLFGKISVVSDESASQRFLVSFNLKSYKNRKNYKMFNYLYSFFYSNLFINRFCKYL